MKNRGLISVVVLALVIGLVALLYARNQPPKVIGGGQAVISQISETQTGNVIAGGTATFDPPLPSPQETPTAATVPADPDFQKWLVQEAKDVDQPKIDSAKKKRELAKVIAELTPNKARQLLQTVQSGTASAGEKILSAYILVEGGEKTQAELSDLLASPMPARGEVKPHSEAEAKTAQDRSLRIMALDGLATRAKTDVSAREALAQSISSIQDPYVKDYAQKRLNEIRNR